MVCAMSQPMQTDDAWRDGEPAYLFEYRAAMAPFDGKWAWGDGNDYADVQRQRRSLIRKYGYAVPTLEALDAVAELAPLFEAGAGCGYWARLLQDRGCPITPFDIGPPGSIRKKEFSNTLAWTKVYGPDEWETVAAEAADTSSLFVGWPYRGGKNEWIEEEGWERLALITDGPSGGDRANDRLYQVLDSAWRLDRELAIPCWPYTWDKLTLWSRP